MALAIGPSVTVPDTVAVGDEPPLLPPPQAAREAVMTMAIAEKRRESLKDFLED